MSDDPKDPKDKVVPFESLVESTIALVRQALTEDLPFHKVIAELERALIACAQRRHNCWNKVQRRLKIPRTTLYSKRRDYDIK